MQDLDACSSASERALLLISIAAVTGRVPDKLVSALEKCDPIDFARSAQLHQVHTMVGCVIAHHPELSKAIPRDLTVFFHAMYEANQERLAAGIEQLKDIGRVLAAAEIPAVALKGGADMLAPLHADPAMRFVADLDILIPVDCIERAKDLLLAEFDASQPYEKLSEDSDLNWRGQRVPEHHLPKIVAEFWQFPVELHMLVGARRVSQVLPTAEVVSHSVPTAIEGMSIPSPEDRACHLIAHAARHGKAVSMRAWIDWVRLSKLCDEATVSERLSGIGLEQEVNEFAVLATQLEGIAPTTDPDRAILRNALMRIGDARSEKKSSIIRILGRRLQALFVSAKYRSHIASEVQNLRWWSQILTILRRRH